MKVGEKELVSMIKVDRKIIEAWPTLREYVQYCAQTNGKPMMHQAAELDLSPSHWSRKLASNPNDTMRLTIADVEAWMEKNNDYRPVQWLVIKYMLNGETNHEG